MPVVSRMRDPIDTGARLALDLALPVRHDGKGGFADDLTAPAGLTARRSDRLGGPGAWVRAHPEILPRTARDRSDGKDGPAATPDSSRRVDHEDIATGTAPRSAAGDGGTAGFTADAAQLDDAQLAAVREPRDAVRALFARPGVPASPAPRTRAASCRGVKRCGSSTRPPPTPPPCGSWTDPKTPPRSSGRGPSAPATT
ncbi:hypothetical protein ACFYN9_36810 [Streptomyces collinus]|uniref:hypothetical protein n=1 Tax=Streptomyces collinus TaxID=42684 RepID=UPI00368322F8